nr:DUF309 domain-containing protein [Lysinibacillus timonensis]
MHHPLYHPLFVDYCTYFNGNRDYFECHEVLEEYWKIVAPGKKHHPLVGYIQLATGMYHWRRRNKLGATRMLNKAYQIFRTNTDSIFLEFLDVGQLCEHCLKCMADIKSDCPFKEFDLPLNNQQLINLVDKQMSLLPKVLDDFLLNKHMLRDRSDILKARELKKSMRNKEK